MVFGSLRILPDEADCVASKSPGGMDEVDDVVVWGEDLLGEMR